MFARHGRTTYAQVPFSTRRPEPNAANAIGLCALWLRLFTQEAIPGWASTVLPMYLLGGIQLFSLGVIGEYLGKIYLETKRRPRYFIEEFMRHKSPRPPEQ